MMKRLLLTCLLFSALAFSLSAQTRFKLSSWNAIKLTGDDVEDEKSFYYLAFGGVVDKRFKINQEVRLGLFYKSMEYSFGKNDYNFHDFLLSQHPGMTPAQFDSIAEGKVAFGYLSIPVGYNYYLGPRFYLSYNFNLNFSLGNSRYAATDVNADDVLAGDLDKGMVQTMFIDHELTCNFIVLRRIEFFMGVSWNVNSNLLKESSAYSFIEEFGKSSSRYTMMKVGLNLYTFQVKRKKI